MIPPNVRRLWSGLKWVASILVICQAVSFVSFIWEEALQSQGFATKCAIDARAWDVASNCLQRFHRTRCTASLWQHYLGWLCPWMHASYLAYFDSAALSQVQAYDAMLQARRFGQPIPNQPPTAGVISTNPFPQLDWSSNVFAIYTNSTGSVRSGHVATATEEFWAAWRADKESLKAAGYSCRKTTNGWQAVRFSKP